MSIPKIIHQIWIGPKKKPNIWTDTWEKDYMVMYPEYQYILWSDDNVINVLSKYPLLHEMYELENLWSAKSDILRYVILYECGGIYIDADSVWLNNKNLDELINRTDKGGIFVGREPDSERTTTGVMGSSKNNEIMFHVIKELEKEISNNGKLSKRKYMRHRSYKGVAKLIGPYFFDNLCRYKITIFPSHYFYPISWHNVSSIDQHKHMSLPEDSFMFQYGYTTNDFCNKIG